MKKFVLWELNKYRSGYEKEDPGILICDPDDIRESFFSPYDEFTAYKTNLREEDIESITAYDLMAQEVKEYIEKRDTWYNEETLSEYLKSKGFKDYEVTSCDSWTEPEDCIIFLSEDGDEPVVINMLEVEPEPHRIYGYCDGSNCYDIVLDSYVNDVEIILETEEKIYEYELEVGSKSYLFDSFDDVCTDNNMRIDDIYPIMKIDNKEVKDMYLLAMWPVYNDGLSKGLIITKSELEGYLKKTLIQENNSICY